MDSAVSEQESVANSSGPSGSIKGGLLLGKLSN
jgi:hypothetical protein